MAQAFNSLFDPLGTSLAIDRRVVNANRSGQNACRSPSKANDIAIRFRAKQVDHGPGKVLRIFRDMKADQVAGEQALQDGAPPRQGAEDFGRRGRNVPKKTKWGA